MQATWNRVYHALFPDQPANERFSKFTKAFSNESDQRGVDVDELYLDAFNAYCEDWEQTTDSTDATYLAGLQLCKEIRKTS
jgi:hypothetical protein